MKNNIIAVLLVLLATTGSAFAAPAITQPYSFTYQGKLMNTSGTAPLSAVINLKLGITDPTGNCLIYEEQQTGIDLSQTNGLFAVQIGTIVGDTKRTASDLGLSMSQVFANSGTQLVAAGGSCTSGYTPASGDVRKLRVTVNNGGTITQVSPDLVIGTVPHSLVSETIQGLTPAQLTTPGFIMPFAGSTCPAGYVLADGSSQPTTGAFANLYATIGYSWGGSGTSFKTPDLRGYFLRGVDLTGTVDPQNTTRTALNAGGATGAAVGSYQQDDYKSHTHLASSYLTKSNYHTMSYATGTDPNVGTGNTMPGNNGGISTDAAGGSETRPKNAYVNYCVKF